MKVVMCAAWEEEANEARAFDGARDVEGVVLRVVVMLNVVCGVVLDL